ncbi:MAG: DUF61 family protein [Dehalococcoidia bacterium]
MSSELPYEKMLQQCLRSELRLVNAGLPRNQKSLSGLLREEYPHVMCSDGSTHFFKRRELEYLSSMIDTDEQEALLLPMIIELEGNQAEAALICQGEIEEKVTSKVLNMPVTCEHGRVRIYRPQLALLRKMLKTTTQYVFSPKIMA